MTYTIDVQNVCQALPATVDYLLREGRPEPSRAGDVLVAPGPVMTVTRRPAERVLFSAVRDANPFFHLAEAIWMLAGRDDAVFLNNFISDFGSRFAEPDGRVHDAYGQRWRSALGFDQLGAVVEMLRRDPASRQAVISMWDPRNPFWGDSVDVECGGEDDLLGKWRGRPCNTHVYLRVREGALELTVCCRSNDMVWGAHGANAVHFSILQEYLAARIDVSVGTMYQLSNNAHVYIDELKRLEKHASDKYDGVHQKILARYLEDDRYYGQGLVATPMFTMPGAIDEDVRRFVGWHDAGVFGLAPEYANPWFHDTLTRAIVAHRCYREGHAYKAVDVALTIEAADWRVACAEWLRRRKK